MIINEVVYLMETELIPYLTFENTKSALDYYQQIFGVTDVFRTVPTPRQAEEMSLNADVDLNELTVQGGFTILGQKVFCADSFLGKPVVSSLVSLMLQVSQKDSAAVSALETLYQRVSTSDGVKVISSYEKKPTGEKSGQVVDKFGITWILKAVK